MCEHMHAVRIIRQPKRIGGVPRPDQTIDEAGAEMLVNAGKRSRWGEELRREQHTLSAGGERGRIVKWNGLVLVSPPGVNLHVHHGVYGRKTRNSDDQKS